jgi:hypothetical protein
MAVSAVSSVQLFGKMKILAYDFDPDESAITDIGWVDMKNYETFAAIFVRTVGTGALDTFNIIANWDNSTGTDVTVKVHALGSAPDAQADMVLLECTNSEIAQLQSNVSTATNKLRYVTAECEFATSTDEGVVIYIQADPKFPQSGLTADVVA